MINKVGVLGAGQMGSGIAHVLAAKGIEVVLFDIAEEQLTRAVAGIGKKYEPDMLVGKTIVIVANLKPAKLMGIESQGMVLAAGDSEVRGLATIIEEVDPGTKVK